MAFIFDSVFVQPIIAAAPRNQLYDLISIVSNKFSESFTSENNLHNFLISLLTEN